MDDAELGSDEQVLARAQMVRIKSVVFEGMLTSKRIILIDKIKGLLPRKTIPLATIKDVKSGENAAREQVITLTIVNKTGDARQMVLTFDRQTAGEYGSEADEWEKALKKYVAGSVSSPVDMAMGVQVHGQPREEHTVDSGEKKKIETARPIKDQDGHQPSAPKPVGIPPLPEGIFCYRCGNRLPPGSTFCNRCRITVVVPGNEMAASAAPGHIATAPAAVPGPDDHTGWTVEQLIHSIGSRSEDPVPRTESAPAVPEPETVPPAAPPTETPPAADGTPEFGEEPEPAAPEVPPQPPVPAAPRKIRSGILVAAVIIIVILVVAAGGFIVMKNLQKTTVVPTVATPLPTTVTTVPTPIPTPVVTVVAVTTIPVPQITQVLIPQTGVWVEITYDRNYTGWVGTPNTQQDVTDTGDHFYNIPTADVMVAVSVQKTDGSGDELKVIVYNDGKTVKTVSTTAPSGVIDLQFSLATPTPTPTPVLTPLPTLPLTSNTTTAVNTTNSTVSP
ncbi:hypothetical protein [Methanoregula sp.]|uniref:hypothetical protein n=1 Tax=Methanoregula sp. TaxID=2052170 RepID=UPI003BAFA5B3